MNRKWLLVSIITVLLVRTVYSQTFAVAVDYTPVLNTYDFFLVFGGNDGNTVKLDDRGMIAELEFIALPGTVFNINEIIEFNDRRLKYFRVTTDDYVYKGNFYVDSRMVKTFFSKPKDRVKIIPEKSEIIAALKNLNGYPYMWGGNYAYGLLNMMKLYPPNEEISEKTKILWILKGVDCSGLLYQATNGCTPRNTSSLTTYGVPVEIADKSLDEIIPLLKPLDLIVWNGHVVIVLDEEKSIESSPPDGVHMCNLKERLKEIMTERYPVNEIGQRMWKNEEFVVRRWIE
ncbi:MAG: peptidoglycan endopeptidase [Ignavibacteria bacterium]|nr:peptidoglycan endopeptidase [Ignavibacteria bacterium]